MAITPPSERIWWNEPIAKTELVWIALGFLWGLVMFLMMIYWHATGEQNLSNEAYRIDPDVFAARAEAMVDQYT
ncbi:MAG: cytochrome C oxidase subunit II, partial [Gammaproteobacteria bacterium]|nr:cytochrome C oxidase subunit II [Gammaproteobacteria bacterium]